MPEVVNLTPHPIRVRAEDGTEVVIPPSGKVARVKPKQVQVSSVALEGYRDNEDDEIVIPVVKTELGEVEGLPPYSCLNCKYHKNNHGECDPDADPFVPYQCKHFEPVTLYIVSTLVAQACKGRKDVVAPDTSPESVVRDESGQIVAVRRFQVF